MKFHMPQRMICFVQAETEGDTLFFCFCSFRNFRKYTFNSLFQIYCQKRIASYVWIVYWDTFSGSCLTWPGWRLEHTLDWSVIWHNFDVVDTSTRRLKREWNEWKTIELSTQKNLKRFSRGKFRVRKRHLPDSFGPKTRRRSCPPREKYCLRDASESRDETKRERYANRAHCPPRRKGWLGYLRKEDRAVRPEKNTALLCRDGTKRESHAKRTHCPPRREGWLGYLR